MSASDYATTALFGGAIEASIPTTFADASTIRDIPSNQEVFLEVNGLGSIIIEILEYACPPDHPCSTDEEALHYHYADLIETGHVREGTEDEDETTRFLGGSDVVMERLGLLPGLATPRIMSIIGVQIPQGAITQSRKVDMTVLLMTLVRLKEKGTDILITVNVPLARGEYDPAQVNLEAGKLGPLVNRGMQIREEIWRTFSVKDWGLFDG